MKGMTMTIDLQQMRSLVHDVVLYEAHEQAPALLEEGLAFDIEKTVDAVFEYLINQHDYLQRLEDYEQWLFEESVHLNALDYFSSYEAVFRKGNK
tara:strand:+ start:281 stop:565 length:285 start_codon:yes stop_codon:yes gene_type:complete